MTRQMQIGHRKRFLELQVRDGVEDFINCELFQKIDIKALALIKEATKSLEKIMIEAESSKTSSVMNYKL